MLKECLKKEILSITNNICRLQSNGYREEAYIDIKHFREVFYKEVAKTLDFIIKLKLEEAKDKINEYKDLKGESNE